MKQILYLVFIGVWAAQGLKSRVPYRPSYEAGLHLVEAEPAYDDHYYSYYSSEPSSEPYDYWDHPYIDSRALGSKEPMTIAQALDAPKMPAPQESLPQKIECKEED